MFPEDIKFTLVKCFYSFLIFSSSADEEYDEEHVRIQYTRFLDNHQFVAVAFI